MPPQPSGGTPRAPEPASPSALTDAFESVPAVRPYPPAGPLHTVFTPGAEAKALELAALDEVIGARKADSKVYPAGLNPYRIEYAIYNMTDKDVIARLSDAVRAGVSVQILIDADQIGPHKPYNRVVDDLVANGFSHAESQVGLDEVSRQSTQIIEIDLPGQGLFHFKSRYFTYPDPTTGRPKETLLTGSHNPQTSAHKNDESLHRITDPGLIHRYVEAFHALRDGKKVENRWDDAEAINVLFTAPSATGPRAVDKIFELVDQEKELVYLTTFNLRNLVSSSGTALVDRLIAAKNRGVPVVVVTDRFGSDGSRAPSTGSRPAGDLTDEALVKAGIPVYEYVNPAGTHTAMHLKAGLFGLKDMKVVTDTGNWTLATMGSEHGRAKNAESLLFVDSTQLDAGATGRTYLAEFLRVLRRYADQNGPGQKNVEELISELQRHPSWPKVEVSFEVLARSAPGQELYLVPGSSNGGTSEVRLLADGSAGLWRSEQKISLPLGLRLEYQLAKKVPGGRLSIDPAKPAVVVVEPDSTGARETSLKVDLSR